jgi:hypothetical protein
MLYFYPDWPARGGIRAAAHIAAKEEVLKRSAAWWEDSIRPEASTDYSEAHDTKFISDRAGFDDIRWLYVMIVQKKIERGRSKVEFRGSS